MVGGMRGRLGADRLGLSGSWEGTLSFLLLLLLLLLLLRRRRIRGFGGRIRESYNFIGLGTALGLGRGSDIPDELDVRGGSELGSDVANL